MNRRIILLSTTLILLAAVALGIWYYSYRHNSLHTQNGPAAALSETSASTSSAAASSSKTYHVLVYFSKHSDSDNDPTKTFAVGRTSPDSGVAKYAISQLLQGPTDNEAAQGYFSTTILRKGNSTCGGVDFKVTIAKGAAKLQFCKPFDHLGTMADGQADNEIKATLEQFAGVKKVIILNSAGSCEFDSSGMNICLQQ